MRFPEPEVRGLDGWLDRGRATVRARVVRPPLGVGAARWVAQHPPPTRLGRWMARLARWYRRFAAKPREGDLVEVRYAGRRWRAQSGEDGLVEITLQGLEPRDADERAEVALEARGDGAAEVPIQRPGPGARQIVVSDVDDTILETEVVSPTRRFAQLLLAEESTRPLFEGVGALYRAFAAQGDPIFYVSNSHWRVRAHLLRMFEEQGLPPGVLMLRGWRPPWRRPKRAHKDRMLDRIAESYPALPILLVGDTTRRDAEHYLELARAHPGRVRTIYLRRVTGSLVGNPDLDALAAQAEAHGVELRVVDRTAEIAEHAVGRGYLDEEATRAVQADTREDHRRPEPMERLLDD